MIVVAQGLRSGPLQTAGTDPGARLRHPRELAPGGGDVREEHEAEAAEHGVEARVGKRQRAGVADPGLEVARGLVALRSRAATASMPLGEVGDGLRGRLGMSAVDRQPGLTGAGRDVEHARVLTQTGSARIIAVAEGREPAEAPARPTSSSPSENSVPRIALLIPDPGRGSAAPRLPSSSVASSP